MLIRILPPTNGGNCDNLWFDAQWLRPRAKTSHAQADQAGRADSDSVALRYPGPGGGVSVLVQAKAVEHYTWETLAPTAVLTPAGKPVVELQLKRPVSKEVVSSVLSWV